MCSNNKGTHDIYTLKWKGHQGDCPCLHWGHCSLPSVSPVMVRAVILMTFLFLDTVLCWIAHFLCESMHSRQHHTAQFSSCWWMPATTFWWALSLPAYIHTCNKTFNCLQNGMGRLIILRIHHMIIHYGEWKSFWYFQLSAATCSHETILSLLVNFSKSFQTCCKQPSIAVLISKFYEELIWLWLSLLSSPSSSCWWS